MHFLTTIFNFTFIYLLLILRLIERIKWCCVSCLSTSFYLLRISLWLFHRIKIDSLPHYSSNLSLLLLKSVRIIWLFCVTQCHGLKLLMNYLMILWKGNKRVWYRLLQKVSRAILFFWIILIRVYISHGIIFTRTNSQVFFSEQPTLFKFGGFLDRCNCSFGIKALFWSIDSIPLAEDLINTAFSPRPHLFVSWTILLVDKLCNTIITWVI